jgi:hypothetical protein
LAFASVPLDDLKLVKNALETAVTDVLISVCAEGLRGWLQVRQELALDPLVAFVSVAGHGNRPDSPNAHWMIGAIPPGAEF